MRIDALVDHGGIYLQSVTNSTSSSLHTPAVYTIISWQPSSTIRPYSYPWACCLSFLLLLVLQTIFNCASTVIFSVAALAASWWTKSCLHCSWVSAGGVLDEAPVVLLDSDLLPPCWDVCGAMTCLCGSKAEDDNEKKWEVLRKMKKKRSCMFWVICSYHQVKMQCVTVNVHILHKLNPAAYGRRLHRLATVLQYATSRSNHECLFTGMNRCEWQPKSRVCEIKRVHSSTERMSADVSLQKSPGSSRKQMLNLMWWCTISIAVPNVVTVKMQV